MSKDTPTKPLYQDPRWNQPLGGRVVGHVPLTPEEEKKAHEETLAILKSMGIEVIEKKQQEEK